jgi:uncharacterized membrane protein YeaQ/YmgE (transglycosylase-associated protein family)
MIIVLAIIGGVIDMIVPGKMPYGMIGGIVAAIIGGLLGAFLLPDFGPALRAFGWQLAIFPALIGAIIFAFIVRFIMGRTGKTTL